MALNFDMSAITISVIQGAVTVIAVRYVTKGAEHLERTNNGLSIWKRLWYWWINEKPPAKEKHNMARRVTGFYEVAPDMQKLPETNDCEKDIFDFIAREKAASIRAIIRYASGYSQAEISIALNHMVSSGALVRKNVVLEEGD